MENSVISVKQLNTYVKNLLESDRHLMLLSVSGEISNFKNHYSSGHLYFTLKDRDAQVRCVMFNSYAARVHFSIEDGMQVVLKGRVSLYERDGQYQFYAEEIHPIGEGDLAFAFNFLKEKLQNEGLFSEDRKRPLKSFPERIAVITSDTGAAVRDIMNILSKRYPVCRVLMCPVAVQGENAVPSMLKALDSVYARDDIDTVIIGRGGGSLEDLWAFNDERLARKILESPVPVISAVGHETDFTICDFVADVRASTPSHAAELAVPDISVLLNRVDTYKRNLSAALLNRLNLATARFELISSKPCFTSPQVFFDNLSLKLDLLNDRIIESLNNIVSSRERRLTECLSKIDGLNPIKTISRGFAAVSSGNTHIKSIKQLSTGQNISLRFCDGTADCTVEKIRSKQ